MDNLGGDNKQQNTPAEIYANIRNKALEEVAAPLEFRLNSRDFYELCQQYRHERIDAAPQFEAIKKYILTGELPWPSYEEQA